MLNVQHVCLAYHDNRFCIQYRLIAAERVFVTMDRTASADCVMTERLLSAEPCAKFIYEGLVHRLR